MLLLSAKLVEVPVLSLRTGGPVAIINTPIFNPNNLKIEGFYCTDRFEHKRLVLLTQDIRDQIGQGFVVDDFEVLVEPEELVRLEKILKLEFELTGKPVVTDKKQKLGKVIDFAVDDATFYVQKLYVSQGLLKSLSGGQLSIDRNQIIEITTRKIVVQEPLQPTKATAPATAVATP